MLPDESLIAEQPPLPSIPDEKGTGLATFRKSIPALSPKHQILFRFCETTLREHSIIANKQVIFFIG